MQQHDWGRAFAYERDYPFPAFPALAVTATAQSQIVISGHETRYARLVALRGGVVNSNAHALFGIELSSLFLRLQVNGEEDLIVANDGAVVGGIPTPNFCEFDGLFGPQVISPATQLAGHPALFVDYAPWFWFAAPPRLRMGDRLLATVLCLPLVGEGGLILTPYLQARIVDDAWWRELYGT